MTMRAFPLRAAVAVLVVVLAALGYALFVKQTRYDTARLSELVIEHPGVKGLKPKAAQAQVVPTASSTYPTVKQLGLSDANGTGSFAATWQGPSSTHDGATVLADLLPTDAAAGKVRTEAAKADLGAGSFSSAKFTLRSHFGVAGVPGAAGSAYSVPESSTSTGGDAYTIVSRFDRVVVSELVESAANGLTQADAVSIARSEYSLLQQVEPGFTMQVTTRPFRPSIIYGAVTLALVALVLVLPGIVRRRRAARHLRQAERARYQYRARGRRAVRRHRTPDWSRPRR
ncbi:MAG TPA: hypothetical protein VMU76_03290 [Acidimicrobiales bacterium]|nr:hypothetical protein [Acidimicrobiales bacterium]